MIVNECSTESSNTKPAASSVTHRPDTTQLAETTESSSRVGPAMIIAPSSVRGAVGSAGTTSVVALSIETLLTSRSVTVINCSGVDFSK